MNGYNCTAIKYAQLLRIGQHETFQKPSVAHQHTALLFQITIWRQTLLIKAVFHPASYTSTVDRSLSGILAKLKFVDCACKLCDLKIAHVCYATYRRVYTLYILSMVMQSQDSENVQRNLVIVQILRLRGTYILLLYTTTEGESSNSLVYSHLFCPYKNNM